MSLPTQSWVENGPPGIGELTAAMADGTLTASALIDIYLARIAKYDKLTNCIVEINPDAHELARQLDAERAAGRVRGPLHGIPALLKDNIDTGDKMQTTAGSLALLGPPAPQDAGIVATLRAAGALIFGKCNLSEWANFRSTRSSSGWSGRGRQTNNPYVLDRNPSGSSSGSGVAAAANFATVTIGTETNGSIVSPATSCGIVGIKPTVGLASRSGIIPIAHSQDTPGPFARTVRDAAITLGALTGVDPRDPVTAESAGRSHTDYTQFLDRDGLRGARIGVAREVYTGYSEHTDRIFESAIAALRAAGATIIDPANIPTAKDLSTRQSAVLEYEFKADLNAYLATRPDLTVRTLADIIDFNDAHAAEEMPYFAQEIMLRSEARGPLTDAEYLESLATNHRLSREEGIDAILQEHNLDAIIAPTGAPAHLTDPINGNRFLGGSSTPAALAGYPIVSVPAGYAFGLPVNISFMGTAYSEPTLLRLAYAFEQATNVWQPPRFLPTLRLP